MNAPKMIATVLAVTAKEAKTPYLSVFITGGINVLVSANDPSYLYIKKGMEITLNYDKIVGDNYPDGKPYVRLMGAKVVGLAKPEMSEANNPFAHLELREDANDDRSYGHLKVVGRV